ncbi:MAG: ATP-binding protein [Firmicutes bacterium]|nr:ATP-binding protein [Bacillota bacterium]
MPTIAKIVITGGPCGGKTTVLSYIRKHFESKGYTVLFIPETATELIGGGICPWTTGTNLDYQICQVELQLQKERIFTQGAMTMPKDKIILICDRGLMDNRVYMSEEDFQTVLKTVGHTEQEFLDEYDAIFHLVTVADGKPELYSFENNRARYENVEQAVALDKSLIKAWSKHPHHHIIDNSTDMEGKAQRLLVYLSKYLESQE